MKRINYILIIFLSLFSCDKKNTTLNDQFCKVDDPMNELVWLKSIIAEAVNPITIHSCSYKNHEGFLVDFCVNCPDGLVVFFDCDSNVLCEFGGIDGRNTCPDFELEVMNKELIYGDTIAANNNDLFCNVNNPLEELNWLKQLVNDNKENEVRAEIYKCIYDSTEGFIIDLCVQCPDGLVEFRDCTGNILCEFGGFDGRVTCPDFELKIIKKELIWTNKD
ncbi:MAG: DUF6970 domain-containing protein [Bacteroidales bacterium]|jgi:hypothetical protein|nr:hypothetical protein [Bacteroidales bacterium]MDI9545034.1 hypothetical protein [Bacteroidota bacterium]OQC02751.1 MAG: hypothetical protein BWX77_01037 [Bacteroidetes bacterium ADurb.Bin090]HOD62618.1 hypothetical protein [Bacilli bacterium]MBP8982688.1 hypothetical protein [Bacteroidales bacterium]